MRIAVFFSGKGSNLEALLSSPVRSSIVLGVTDNTSAPGILHARKHDLPLFIANYTQCVNRSVFEETILEALRQHEVDFIVLAGFMRIMSTYFVNQYVNKIVNIHPSLLPSYPGKNTHEKVFNAGNKIHGISIHFVVPEVDAGPIVAQAAMRVYQEDTPSSLESRIHKLEHWLYPKVVSWIIEGKVHVNDQGKVDIPFCTGFFMDD